MLADLGGCASHLPGPHGLPGLWVPGLRSVNQSNPRRAELWRPHRGLISGGTERKAWAGSGGRLLVTKAGGQPFRNRHFLMITRVDIMEALAWRANVSLRPPQAIWPNKTDAEAAMPWRSLAEPSRPGYWSADLHP